MIKPINFGGTTHGLLKLHHHGDYWPYLVVSDWKTPHMNGLSLLKAVRLSPELHKTHIMDAASACTFQIFQIFQVGMTCPNHKVDTSRFISSPGGKSNVIYCC